MSNAIDEDYLKVLDEASADYSKALIEKYAELGPNMDIYGLTAHLRGDLIDYVGLNAVDYGDKMLMVYVKNQVYIGKLAKVRARTRGNWTLALKKTTIVRRNGRVTKHGTIPLWTLWAEEAGGYNAMCSIFHYQGIVPDADVNSSHISNECPRVEGHALTGFCVTCF